MDKADDYMRDFERLMSPAEDKALPTEAQVSRYIKLMKWPDTMKNRRRAAELLRDFTPAPGELAEL
jgi:hypothetical protein